jgi:hypothetical protein
MPNGQVHAMPWQHLFALSMFTLQLLWLGLTGPWISNYSGSQYTDREREHQGSKTYFLEEKVEVKIGRGAGKIFSA